MDWARIMAPLSGGEADRHVIAAAVAVAEPFGAELVCVHAPPDVADLIPWMGDGFKAGLRYKAWDTADGKANDAICKAIVQARSAGGYDLVILDSPPVMAVSDARIISQLADYTIFIVHWARTPRDVVKTAVAALLNVCTPLSPATKL